MSVPILLTDDHEIVREGLAFLLDRDRRIDVVAQAASGEEAVTVVDALARRGEPPSVVLMDLQLGSGMSGIEATRQIRAAHPEVQVLMLTTFDADADVFGALEAGAVGYILKDTPTDALVRAILDAAAGRPALSPQVAPRVLLRAVQPEQALSPREQEIVELLARGASNREIAKRLFISESTVKGHLVRLYAKLGVDNRTAAARVARERHLIR